MKILGKSFLVVVFMVSLLFIAGNAGAGLIANFDIIYGNKALLDAGWTKPYANVAVDLDNTGTIATITFTAKGSYLMGDGNSAALNLIGTYDTNFSYVANSFTPAAEFKQLNITPNVSEFGQFDFSIKMDDGFAKATSTLSFQLQNLTGVWTTDGANFFDINTKYLAGTHIFPPGGDDTGFAAGDGTTGMPYVPLPPSVWLLGSGLLGLVGLRRRFKKHLKK